MKIRHDAGTARVSFDVLPDDLKGKYRFDYKKAEQQKAEEAEALKRHENSQIVPTGSDEKLPAKKLSATLKSVKSFTETAGIPSGREVRPNEMLIKVETLKAKIQFAEDDIRRLAKLALQERSRTREIRKNNSTGYSGSETVQDKADLAKARKYEAEIELIQLRVDDARLVIQETKLNYLSATGSEMPESPVAN